MDKDIQRLVKNFQTLGFDQFFRDVMRIAPNSTSFPPVNVIQVNDAHGTAIGYELELAVAGYKKNEISIRISHDNGVKELTIQGFKEEGGSNKNYVFNGIANRSFIRRWSLAENLEVEKSSVTFEDGILSIKLNFIRTGSVSETIEIQ